MEQKCVITGQVLKDSEGIKWGQLRPSIQDFLKTVKPEWKDDYFVSYTALNDVLKAYIVRLTDEDMHANNKPLKTIKYKNGEEKK